MTSLDLTGVNYPGGMHANQYSGPRFSDTPILQPAKPTGKVHRPVVARSEPKPRGPWTVGQDNQLHARALQVLASGAALPAAAGILLLCNHYSEVWRLLRGVGIIDCIALSCLAISAILAAPQLVVLISRGLKTVETAVVRLPEMADNIVTLSSTVDLVQCDPAPRHWLDMYYNMVSDIDNLLQEMIKLRKLMSDMHDDVEHVKEKTAWIRFQRSHKHDKNSTN